MFLQHRGGVEERVSAPPFGKGGRCNARGKPAAAFILTRQTALDFPAQRGYEAQPCCAKDA